MRAHPCGDELCMRVAQKTSATGCAAHHLLTQGADGSFCGSGIALEFVDSENYYLGATWKADEVVSMKLYTDYDVIAAYKFD